MSEEIELNWNAHEAQRFVPAGYRYDPDYEGEYLIWPADPRLQHMPLDARLVVTHSHDGNHGISWY